MQQEIMERVTDRQVGYIKGLFRRGLIQVMPSFERMTSSGASDLITRAEEAAGQKAGVTAVSKNGCIPKELSLVRLGLCIKLVYATHAPELGNKFQEKEFKHFVQQLYRVCGELEMELAAQ